MTADLTTRTYSNVAIPVELANYNTDVQTDPNATANATANDDSFKNIIFARLAAQQAADDSARTKSSDNRDKDRAAEANKARQQPSASNATQKTDDATTTQSDDAEKAAQSADADTTDTDTDTTAAAASEAADDTTTTNATQPASDTILTVTASTSLSTVISTLAALVKPSSSTAKTPAITTANGAASGATKAPTLDSAALQKLQTLLSNLLNGTPAAADDTAQVTTAQTAATAAQLASPTNLKNISAALIATGLSPEKLAALITQLKKKTPADDQTGDASSLVTTTVQLTTPAIKRDALFLTGTSGLQAAKATNADNAGTAEAPTGTGKETAAAGAKNGQIAQTQLDPLMAGSNDDLSDATDPSNGFDSILKIFEEAQAQLGGAGTATTAAHTGTTAAATSAKTSTAISPVLSTVPAAVTTTPVATNANINFAANLTDQIYPDGTNWSNSNGNDTAATNAAQTISLTGPALATSLVINVAQSSNPHPTTQAVASTLIKTAADGESSDITLHLDPAELGKVQVQMRIDKDQTVKAHLVVEKPETYLMLQRDSNVLQRALNDAGLSANGNSLSFELGQNGAQSNQNNSNGNGQNQGSGTRLADDNSAAPTETIMNWSITNAAGQTHYNIFA